MQYLLVTGRERLLARAEIESIYQSSTVLTDDILCVESDSPIEIDRLGSVVKAGEVIDKTTNYDACIQILLETTIAHTQTTNKNSVDFGMSLYHTNLTSAQYRKSLVNIKKQLSQAGVRSRFVSADKMILNAAQVIRNQLTTSGIEYMIVQTGDSFILAKTIAVQNIDSYSKRDYARPVRDMRVGMFPPKLAQILINLAYPDHTQVIYDPFCGNGVVLQEALLMGYNAWGADNAEKMIDASKQNLNWITQQYSTDKSFHLFMQDATQALSVPDQPYSIVTEGYLGTPFSTAPQPGQLAQLQHELGNLYVSFLQNILACTHQPESIIITMPIWQTTNGLKQLKVIDQIPKLGYTIKQFAFAKNQPLIYKRPHQIVGRQIMALQINKR